MPKNTELAEPVLAISLGHSHSCVVGSPGSGKTTQLRLAVKQLEAELAPESILVLTPSRQAAALLRDQLAIDSGLPTSSARAKSITGFAFELVQGVSPLLKLLSGAQQHRVLADLVSDRPTAAVDWGINPRAIGLDAFVQELRDLFQVVLEHGLDDHALSELQAQFPELKLSPVIDLLPDYRATLERLGLIDPANLLALAATQITDIPQRWVLVDDAQDLSPAALGLLKNLPTGTNLMLFGDPDAQVQGFRAAEPGAFLEFGNLQFLPARHHSQAASLMAKVSARIPPAGAGRQRANLFSSEGSVSAQIFDNTSAEADQLATWLRKLRLERGIPFSEMAVVARTRTQLDQLSRELGLRGVPNQILGPAGSARENPLARALLEIAKLALGGNELQLFREVLTSSFIGLNQIQLRRLERQLTHYFEEGIGGAWERALAGEFEYESFEARALNRLIDLVVKLRGRELSAHELLSEIWQFAPPNLVALAKGVSNVALAANRDIDAVVRLMLIAQRADAAGVSPGQFISTELDQPIPEDTLAPQAAREAVVLTTASMLPGLEFQAVAIPRLQDGIWPNLRPRNSLLGAASLRTFLAGASTDPTTASRTELAGELRMFYKALGATRGELWLSAMRSADEQPSQFFAVAGVDFAAPDRTEFDLRKLVGKLRNALRGGDFSAASKLAALALLEVPGAHPRSWYGTMDFNPGPLIPQGEAILSASSLAAFESCPLHWFIRTFAVGRESFQASIGTLLHAAFELATEPADIARYLESNWHTLEFENSWQEQAQKRRALTMAALAGEYLAANPNPHGIEQGFELAIGKLRIRGVIDRLERTEDGVRVADLKTGKTLGKAEDNLQLAVYQLAAKQLFPDENLAGAQLVGVGGGGLKISEQPPLTEELSARLSGLFDQFLEQAEGEQLIAQTSEHCAGDGECSLLLAKRVGDG